MKNSGVVSDINRQGLCYFDKNINWNVARRGSRSLSLSIFLYIRTVLSSLRGGPDPPNPPFGSAPAKDTTEPQVGLVLQAILYTSIMWEIYELLWEIYKFLWEI